LDVGQKSIKEPAKAFVKDGIYVPIRFVSQATKEKLDEEYTHHLFKKEEVCETCDYGPDRVCDVCETCANFTGTIKLFSYKKVDDKRYLRLPYGLKESTQEILGRKVEFKEKDRSRPMKRVPKFLAELRPDQKECVRAMVKAEHGVLRSPPRSGKTVMGSAFVCKVGEKTLILAAQKDWLDNFYETFVGSDTQKPMTDIKSKRIGFPKKMEDFERMDVCLCTYQMFLKPKGRKILQKIRKMFGILLIDEVQTVGAPELAQIVNTLDVKYKIGVSGTPERKDCVSGNTIVYTETGPKFIRDVEIGERVLSEDNQYHLVSNKFVRHGSKMVRVQHENGYVDCTPDHKFKTQRGWVAAQNLLTTDLLTEFTLELDCSTSQHVVDVTTIPDDTSYDITVDETHSYFGTTDPNGTPVLVHNCKELLIYGLLGPVFFTNEVKKLRPKLEIKNSGFKGPVPQSWTYIIRKLENDPKRLKTIANEAIADVKAGHLVVIPLTRIPVIKALTAAINKIHGKNIAASFYGGIKKEERKSVIERARHYKVKVVVGNTSLLSTGINIPRASMLYQVTPASNIPKAQQRFSRVLTPMDGKPDPVIKYFLDDVDVVRRCLQKEHWQCMMPMFKPMVSERVKEQLAQYFKGSSNAKENWRRVGRSL
jgi:superfamily II DNA or RNA helicase